MSDWKETLTKAYTEFDADMRKTCFYVEPKLDALIRWYEWIERRNTALGSTPKPCKTGANRGKKGVKRQKPTKDKG